MLPEAFEHEFEPSGHSAALLIVALLVGVAAVSMLLPLLF